MARTHGPKLNRERCREVVDKLKIAVVKSDGDGIRIERMARVIGREAWRLYTGGGIAGNSDSAWLAPVFKGGGDSPRGPFWNKAQLEHALRAWRREHIPSARWRDRRAARAKDKP